MTPYRNRSRNSGVAEYEIGTNCIKVRFHGNPHIYVYDNTAPGKSKVDQMKSLATQGRGLSTFISQSVRDNYARIE